ncbi:alanine racemase [Marinitenerispora sediminis]|uniref:Alanine racemase n=1 Tax=Marinitenerispora sediminis TaxID=1931232 RepID=A0A368SYP4_9ACTN|nr:alanine racemase [Marinitenerispora sediminis]RCV49265.1 alanine racemase [Marinitenerispora sediminis]
MPPTAEALVDLGAVRTNIEVLRDRARNADVMGVVKADGYGHGMVPVARAMVAAGAAWLGTALVEEALQLRRAGIRTPTLAWIIPPGTPLGEAVASDIDLGVSTRWGLDEIAAAARAAGRPARVHLKADTGLSRGGVTPGEWSDVVEAAARAEAAGLLRVTGVFSHFARADEPGHPSIAAQLTAFHDALALAEKAGLRPEVRHMANSAATLTLPDAHFDLVRPGIAGYGLTPIPDLAGTGLRPACMDQFVVDIGDDEARAGEPAVLFGAGDGGEPTAQDWAEALDTISYEIVCRVGQRVPRRYVGGDGEWPDPR